LFWNCEGVYSTAVGYAGGQTPNPTYEEVCSGRTGHTEAVLIVFDPNIVCLNRLLGIFWEEHNPTQYMRQGNDRGTQYRSALYAVDEKQLNAFHSSAAVYQKALTKSGYKKIQTEIKKLTHFYYAEDYHQQYLHKVPNGYCGLSGCGISYDYTS
jgi:peptide-methionine (S)-S-oxide reductase